MFNSLKIPFAFLITGICWALFSNPFITFLAQKLNSRNQDGFRSINDFIFVIIIAFVLYFEIKKHERELSKSEEEYRQLFESNPNPMWIYSRQTLKFIKVNNAAIEKYRYSRHMFSKMTIHDIRPEDECGRLNDYLNTTRDSFNHAGKWKHMKGNGEMFNVSIISHAVLFNNQECVLVMATDITELLDKEIKLQKAYRRIESANEALLQVSWSNSHELRKPLCSILGLITLMKFSGDMQEFKEMLYLLEDCSLELDKVLKQNNEKVSQIEMKELN